METVLIQGEPPRIGSIKSLKFLEDIIFEFKLNMKPKPHNSNNKVIGHYLTLGGQFFNKLLDNYEKSLPRKRLRYKNIQKFQFSKEQLQKIIKENPLISAKEIADLHINLYGISVTETTVTLHLREIEKISKDEYYRLKTIELRKKGSSLKHIFSKVFNLRHFDIYGKVFFRRIFTDDSLIKNQNTYGKNIFKAIEGRYRPESDSK